MLCKILRSPHKNNSLDCFWCWVRLSLSKSQRKTRGTVKKRHLLSLVEARGVFRTLPCAIASLSLVTHVGKNSTLYCFLPQIERFAPSLFDSPLTLYPKQKRQHLTALSFLFWWRRGESNPCPKICPYRHLRAQMVINIPSAKRRPSANLP